MRGVWVGKIVGVFGLKGECKVASNSDFKEVRFKQGNILWLQNQSQNQTLEIRSRRTHKNLELITFQGVDSIEKAEKLVGLDLYVKKDDLPALEKGAYYLHELLNLQVVTTQDEVIGHVKEVKDVPQGHLLIIQREGKKDVSIPFVEAFIKQVTEQTIVVELIEGLIS